MSTCFYWDQDLTASDFFCGAGGLGCGFAHAGVNMTLAVNHDARSIATYRRNFPAAKCLCVKMEAVNFAQEPDTLIGTGAPECTYHSPSAGEALDNQGQLRGFWTDHDDKDAVEQSRMSMWQVQRAAEAKAEKHMPYHSMVFENVPEVHKWRDYNQWKEKIIALGYECQMLYLNTMHFNLAQCRDRWIAVFGRKGAKRPDLEFRPLAPCLYCGKDVQAVQCWKNLAKKQGKYEYRLKGQYTYNCPHCAKRVHPYYKPAAAVIDDTDRGIRIRDRKDYKLPELDEKTMQRIKRGIDLFVKRRQVPPVSAQGIPPLQEPLPFWISYYSNGKPYSIFEPFCTFSTRDRCALVFPPTSGSLDIAEFGFRMLNEQEIMAGSGLSNGRMVSEEDERSAQHYEIVAETKEEVVRQCGHMVPHEEVRGVRSTGGHDESVPLRLQHIQHTGRYLDA